MNRYPHKITLVPVDATQRNSKGYWIKTGDTSSIQHQCRYAPGSGNGTINGKDGAVINFSAIVYMPLGSPVFPQGSMVVVNTDDKEITDTVKQYHKGLFGVRVWI